MGADDLFGGFFDLNNDGHTDIWEEWLAFQCFEEWSKSSGSGGSTSIFGPRTTWRDTCEDGLEYGLDPMDYEDEEDYEAALMEAKYAWRETCEDGGKYGLDPMDYEMEEDYEAALEQARYAWREFCEDGLEYGLDPEDYEEAEDYEAALLEAKYDWIDMRSYGPTWGFDPQKYRTMEMREAALRQAKLDWKRDCEEAARSDLSPLDYDTPWDYLQALKAEWQAWQEEYDRDGKYAVAPRDYGTKAEYAAAVEEAAKRAAQPQAADYPNRRSYAAARALHEIGLGDACYLYDEDEEAVARRCRFILEDGGIPAAGYLTPEGDFLYAQAIQEHFALPFPVEAEDERVKTPLPDLICRLAEKDAPLAFRAWQWCVEQFYPYREYGQEEERDYLINCLACAYYRLPAPFVDQVLEAVIRDDGFARTLMTAGEDSHQQALELIPRLLRRGEFAAAWRVFSHSLAWHNTAEKVCDLVEDMLQECENYDELEAMEGFKEELFPLVREIGKSRVQRSLGKWQRRMDEYIDEVESNLAKYAYTRKNAWRSTCEDGSAYGLSPIEFDALEEYDLALREAKYYWRTEWRREAAQYGLDLNAYETEQEFRAALAQEEEREERRQEERREAQWQRQLAEAAARLEREQARTAPTGPEPDPLAHTDMTVYTFCAVQFQHSSPIYYYRTLDESLTVGDRVVVPVGEEERELEAEILSVEKHRRLTAPYPVDRAKFILRRAQAQEQSPEKPQ